MDYQPELTLRSEIVAYSGAPLLDDELFLIARSGDAPFDTLALAPEGDNWFAATLDVPVEGGELAYYFHAADASGRVERYPFVGAPGARPLTVRPDGLAAELKPVGSTSFQAVNPNPARTSDALTLRFSLGQPAHASVEVFDVLGRRVATLADEETTAGEHPVAWRPSGLPAGAYVARLRAGSAVLIRDR